MPTAELAMQVAKLTVAAGISGPKSSVTHSAEERLAPELAAVTLRLAPVVTSVIDDTKLLPPAHFSSSEIRSPALMEKLVSVCDGAGYIWYQRPLPWWPLLHAKV